MSKNLSKKKVKIKIQKKIIEIKKVTIKRKRLSKKCQQKYKPIKMQWETQLK